MTVMARLYSSTWKLLAVVVMVLSAAPAQATLIDRGRGLIYDDVLDITWFQDATVGGTQNWLEAVAWTRDRSGLIVVHRITEDSNEMLYVDDQDRITVLWKGAHTRVMRPTVSPDGRKIAFALGTRNPNVWMLRGF